MARPATVANAARREDKRETLVALRNKIAKTIDTSESGRDIAALSKRLIEVMEELENLEKEVESNDSPLKKAMLRDA